MPDAPPVPPFVASLHQKIMLTLAVSLILIAGGVWLLLIASRLYSAQIDLRAHAGFATGVIVGFKRTYYYDQGIHQQATRFAPVFTFADAAGTTRRVISKVGYFGHRSYSVGQTVPVVYHREHPDEADFDTFSASWGGALADAGIGTMFVVAGGLAAVVNLRRARAAFSRDLAILVGP